MLVKLEDIDELYSILLDLEIFAYLQGLVEFDADGSCVFEHSFSSVHRNAQSYLCQKQLETVERLGDLLYKDGFCRPLKGL